MSNSLATPKLDKLVDYPNIRAQLKDDRVLWGVDEAELRVVTIDSEQKMVFVAFHAVSVLNPMVSTGRAIMLTYTSMKNTVAQIFRNLF